MPDALPVQERVALGDDVLLPVPEGDAADATVTLAVSLRLGLLELVALGTLVPVEIVVSVPIDDAEPKLPILAAAVPPPV